LVDLGGPWWTLVDLGGPWWTLVDLGGPTERFFVDFFFEVW